jgi:DNA primase
MRNICQKYGIEPNGAGFIPCPFHSDKTSSLKIYPDVGRGFYCYGCSTGGDVIKFVQLYFRLNFSDAMKKIESDFSITGTDNADYLKEKRERDRADRLRLLREHTEFLVIAKRTVKLRNELNNLKDIMEEWSPAKCGYIPLMWVDAAHRIDAVRGELEQLILC